MALSSKHFMTDCDWQALSWTIAIRLNAFVVQLNDDTHRYQMKSFLKDTCLKRTKGKAEKQKEEIKGENLLAK